MIHSRFLLSIWVGVSVATSSLLADHWPQWRGPTGDGVSREVGRANLLVRTGRAFDGNARCRNGEPARQPYGTMPSSLPAMSTIVSCCCCELSKRSGRIEWTCEVGTGHSRTRGHG